MNEPKTDLQVPSMEAAADAIAYARTAMLPAFTVTCTPPPPFSFKRNDLRRQMEDPLSQLQETLFSVFQEPVGSFAAAQQYSCGGSCQMDPFSRKTRLDAAIEYFTSSKEANDLICLAAEIGMELRSKLGQRPTVEKIIHVYQRWINTTFRYAETGQIEDHSAAALIRSRSGVCQAIAALTVLVLPHLGLLTRYISGLGRGSDGLGRHAWNLIRVASPSHSAAAADPLQWYHVDFTFGMNCPTPHTLTPISALAFEKTHQWDAAAVSPELLHRQFREEERLRGAQIRMKANDPRWQLGEITITSPSPLLVGSSSCCHWIGLSAVLRFLGGGCEYLPAENRLRICLGHRQYLVENGSCYLGGPEGYLSVSILRHLPVQIFGAEDTLSIKVVPS